MDDGFHFDVVAWARRAKAELSRTGWRAWTAEQTADLARRLGGKVIHAPDGDLDSGQTPSDASGRGPTAGPADG